MGLEDFIPEIESSEGTGKSAESIKEASEKYKETSKKEGKKVKQVKGDEKKAKKYDFLLAGFMVKIIVDKKYDFLLESLFNTIHNGYPSNFILGILSLINIEISNEIRDVSNKPKVIFDYEIQLETEIFNDNNINTKIKDRINFWIEDIIDSVVLEYSNIQTEKLKLLLVNDKKLLLEYTSNIFIFFLNNINIQISKERSENISNFIIGEIKKSIDKLEIKEI